MENLRGNKAHRTPGAPYFLLSRFTLNVGAHYGVTPDTYDSHFRCKLRKAQVPIKKTTLNLRVGHRQTCAHYFLRLTLN
jgi:hypothetical protein